MMRLCTRRHLTWGPVGGVTASTFGQLRTPATLLYVEHLLANFINYVFCGTRLWCSFFIQRLMPAGFFVHSSWCCVTCSCCSLAVFLGSFFSWFVFMIIWQGITRRCIHHGRTGRGPRPSGSPRPYSGCFYLRSCICD